MRKSVFALLLLLAATAVGAQETKTLPTEGEAILLGRPSASNYQHIAFPRQHMIIKRGAIADFASLYGKKLIIEAILQEEGGTKAILRRADGLKFFRFYKRIEADLQQALATDELVRKS